MTTSTAKAETPEIPLQVQRRLHPVAAIRAARSSEERCRLLLANLDAVADLLEAGATASENERSLSDQSTDTLRSAGIFGMLVPDDLGGNEVAPLVVYEVLKRLSSIDTSTAWAAAILLQIASSFACQTGVDIVTRVFRMLGSRAIRDETLIARQLRDLNTLAAHGGLGEAGFENHGAFILGLQDEAGRSVV